VLDSCTGALDIGCNAAIPNFCGDGTVVGAEECDDGNITSGDGCRGDCTDEVCGDGVVDVSQGEVCDDGNLIDSDGCSSSCQPDSGCIGENACSTHNKTLVGSRCATWTVCIPTGGGWYSVTGTAGGTTLGDVQINGTALDLDNITTGLTRRSDYDFLSAGNYTLEVCDDTGAGIGDITGCIAPQPFISQRGIQSGNLSDEKTDNTDASSSRGNIDLAGPVSGGDECYVFEVAAAGDYQVVVSNDSGGAIMDAGIYTGDPADANLVAGSSTGIVPVFSSAAGGVVSLSPGTYHICADVASLGSFGNYTLTLQAQ
jgi:cysteine-rich repeat protein